MVEKHIGDFKTNVWIYINRVEDKIKLLTYTTEGFSYLPASLFKKGGGNPGLADYFLGGLPVRDCGLRVWNSVDEKTRTACVEWQLFAETFVEANEFF